MYGLSLSACLYFQSLFFRVFVLDPQNKEGLPSLLYVFLYIIYYVFFILDSCCFYGLSCNPNQIEIPHHILYDEYLRTWRVGESTDIHLIICSFAQVKAKHDNWKWQNKQSEDGRVQPLQHLYDTISFRRHNYYFKKLYGFLRG